MGLRISEDRLAVFVERDERGECISKGAGLVAPVESSRKLKG